MAISCEKQHGGVGAYSPFVRRKLHALGCPFSLDEYAPDWKAVRDIVVWLEEEKIRLYPRRRRVPLRTVDSWNEWWSLMKQYCRDLEMPLIDDNSSATETARTRKFTSLLDTLTSMAIGDVYQDAVEANAMTSQPPAAVSEQTDEGRPAAYSATTLAVTQEELQAGLKPLLALLQLPLFRESQASDYEIISALRAVAARLRLSSPSCATKTEQVVPLSDEELQHVANRVLVALPDAGRGNKHFLTRFLSGLRALHICTLRDTHERLEVVVEALQTLTGNPVTDSNLGKSIRFVYSSILELPATLGREGVLIESITVRRLVSSAATAKLFKT